MLVGAAGTLLGGLLAQRWGRIRTVRVAYAVAVPALAGVSLVPGPAVYLLVALAAVALYTPCSLHVTLGQDYLPGRPGTASGVTLGLAVSVGGLAAPAVANASTLQLALLSLVVLPALAYAAARGMIDPHHEPRPQQTVASIGV